MALAYSSGIITVTGGKESGTATSGTSTTLTDTSKSWTTNAFAGYQVWIHTGTGAGALAYIKSNTSNTLDVSWSKTPFAGALGYFTGGGFYKIDHDNTVVTAVTPDNTSQYLIKYRNIDLYNADVSGGWGKVTKQDTHQYNINAKLVIGDGSTKTGLSTCEEDMTFPSTVALPMIRVRSGAYFVNGRYYDTSKGSTISDYNTTESSEDTSAFLQVDSGGYFASFGDSKYVCKVYEHPITFYSGSYVAILGGNGGFVCFDTYQIRQRTTHFYCDGLLCIGDNPSSEFAPFSIISTSPEIKRLVLRGKFLGTSGSSTTSGSTYTLIDPIFLDNKFDWRPWAGHIYNLVNPTWNASILAQSNAASGYGYCNEKYTFDMTVTSSDVGVSTVQCYCKDQYGTLIFNTTTNASGVLPQQQILYKYYAKTVNTSTTYATTTYSPHFLKVRKYGYKPSEEPITFNAKVVTRKSLSVNPYIIANEATASAYTGIAINGSAKTSTLTSARTMQEAYDYSQYWSALSANMQYEVPLTTTEGNNFTLETGWKIVGGQYLDLSSKRLSGGTIQYSVAGTYSPKLGEITIEFAQAGTYVMGGADISGQVTLTNSSGGNVTVQLEAGVSYVNSGPNITVSQPVTYQGLSFSGLVSGSQVIVFTSGTQTVVDYVETSGTTYEWSEVYSADQTIDYTIINEGYTPIRVTGVVLSTSVRPISVQQTTDRAYQASSGLTYGSTATYNVGTGIFGLTTGSTLQNYHSFMVESWRSQSALRNVAFPIVPNGSNSFTFTNGTEFDGTSIAYLSRDGLRYTDGGTETAKWCAILTSGVPTGLQVRYQQVDGSGTTDAKTTGNMDELIQIMGDSTHGDFDYTGHLVLKVQADGYDQAEANVVTTYGTLQDEFYVVGLVPTNNGLATGDPGISGVSILNHGASPVTWNGLEYSITITDGSTEHTGEEIMRLFRYSFSQGSESSSFVTFNWHDLVRTNGSKFKTVRGFIYGDTGAEIKGVRVVKFDGVTPHPDFDVFTADDGSTYEPPLSISVTAGNLISGTRVLLKNDTQDITLDNSVVSGSGGYSYSTLYGTGEEIAENDTIHIYATYASGTTAKLPLDNKVVASGGNISFIDEQEDDDIYIAYGYDGSNISKFDADYTDTEIDLIVSSNFSAKEMYAWWVHNLTTEDGISNFYGGLTAEDEANIKINDSVIDVMLDNDTSTNVYQTDNIRVYRSDETYPVINPTSGGGGIDVVWRDRVYTSVVTVSGSNVITGDIADLNDISVSEVVTGMQAVAGDFKADVSGIPTADEIADEVMSRDVATNEQTEETIIAFK